jgi:hypothetical protein
MLGFPENWALQYSQIPSTGTFLTRFTIRSFRWGISQFPIGAILALPQCISNCTTAGLRFLFALGDSLVKILIHLPVRTGCGKVDFIPSAPKGAVDNEAGYGIAKAMP